MTDPPSDDPIRDISPPADKPSAAADKPAAADEWYHPHPKSFSIAQRIRSFPYALRGIRTLIATQHNAWLHGVATIGVLVLGAICSLSRWEWCAVFLSMGTVWAAEAINTAIERLGDAITTRYDENIRDAKDLAAGAVLIVAMVSVLVAVLVFTPHLLSLLIRGLARLPAD